MAVSVLRSVFGAVRYNILFSFLSELAPIYPVYMILFRERGYDFLQMSLLFVIWELAVVTLELPSGVLADRWDKRKVLAVGMVLKALGFCAWLVWPSFGAAAVGFALWGAQEAFCSGTRQALLYEALRDRCMETSYDKAAGISNAAATSAVALSLVIGGPLFAGSPGLTLALSAAAAAVGARAALSIRTRRVSGPQPHAAAESSEVGAARSGGEAPETAGEGGSRTGLAASLRSFRRAFRDRRLALLLVTGCLSIAAYGTLDEFDGLWALERYGVPLAWVGAWGALRFGAEGVGALAAGFLRKPGTSGSKVRIGPAVGVAGAAFAAAAFLPGLYGIPLYIGGYFLMSAVNVAFETRLQEAAEDGSRAGFLSLSSLLMTLCAMALAPLLGLAGNAGGLPGIFAVGVGIILAAGSLTGAARLSRRRAGDRASSQGS
jgi:MFS family permease